MEVHPLLHQLDSLLSQEVRRPGVGGQGAGISPGMRDGSAHVLRCLKVWYDLPSDVFHTALSNIDTFLAKMKVGTIIKTRSRFLRMWTFYSAVHETGEFFSVPGRFNSQKKLFFPIKVQCFVRLQMFRNLWPTCKLNYFILCTTPPYSTQTNQNFYANSHILCSLLLSRKTCMWSIKVWTLLYWHASNYVEKKVVEPFIDLAYLVCDWSSLKSTNISRVLNKRMYFDCVLFWTLSKLIVSCLQMNIQFPLCDGHNPFMFGKMRKWKSFQILAGLSVSKMGQRVWNGLYEIELRPQ